jgi:hypothetical protein
LPKLPTEGENFHSHALSCETSQTGTDDAGLELQMTSSHAGKKIQGHPPRKLVPSEFYLAVPSSKFAAQPSAAVYGVHAVTFPRSSLNAFRILWFVAERCVCTHVDDHPELTDKSLHVTTHGQQQITHPLIRYSASSSTAAGINFMVIRTTRRPIFCPLVICQCRNSH